MKVLFIEMLDIESECKKILADFDIESYNFSIKIQAMCHWKKLK